MPATRTTSGSDQPQTRIDILINALFYALAEPCSRKSDIAKKMGQQLGERIATRDVSWALGHLRRNADEYQWTVPHVSRSPNAEDRRYIRILVDRDGEIFAEDDTDLAFIMNGLRETIATCSKMQANETSAIDMLAPYVQSVSLRRRIRAYATKLNYLSEEGRELMEAVVNLQMVAA